MFLFYLILFSFSNRIHARNASTKNIPTIEDMYPLPMNDQLEIIAAQFHQNSNWEHGNVPMPLTEAEETTPIPPNSQEPKIIPDILKTGHHFHPNSMHPYRIDLQGVHRHSEHHIFLTRHGELKRIQ